MVSVSKYKQLNTRIKQSFNTLSTILFQLYLNLTYLEMPEMNNVKNTGLTTEQKIKEAAQTEFMKNGYAATKIRDIAISAGINLALMNYYFRSKEKLFEIVMSEKIDQLFALILPLLNDSGTTLAQKLEKLSEHYTDMLLQEPSLPIFVLNEIQHNPERFGERIRFNTEIMQSSYIGQLAGADPDNDPVGHLITYLGMLIFPFLMKPVMQASGTLKDEQFEATMLQRKKLAPLWMKQILGI